MRKLNTIIWDWNGTLLDDVSICLESINVLLENRNLPVLNKKEYRDIFSFPVKDYYSTAGFDFSIESFDEVAVEFIDLYYEKLKDAQLFEETANVLSTMKGKMLKQIMVSAMEHKSLIHSVKEKGIFTIFDHISGIEDHLANGKLENARRIVREQKIDPEKTCLIGDTNHDYEVAKKIGVNCILVANGHQSFERLKMTSCMVVHDLNDLLLKLELN